MNDVLRSHMDNLLICRRLNIVTGNYQNLIDAITEKDIDSSGLDERIAYKELRDAYIKYITLIAKRLDNQES